MLLELAECLEDAERREERLAEGVTLGEARERIAAAPGIEELFRVAHAFNPIIDPALGPTLADRVCTLRTAAGVLKALIYTNTQPDIPIPEGATMH
jgi:hypothetical protein